MHSNMRVCIYVVINASKMGLTYARRAEERVIMACGALIRWDECKRCVLFVRIRTDVRILKEVMPRRKDGHYTATQSYVHSRLCLCVSDFAPGLDCVFRREPATIQICTDRDIPTYTCMTACVRTCFHIHAHMSSLMLTTL
jgi:hypothetical protein